MAKAYVNISIANLEAKLWAENAVQYNHIAQRSREFN